MRSNANHKGRLFSVCLKSELGDFATSNFAKVRFQHSVLTTEHLSRWQLSDYCVASSRLAVVWRAATRKKLKSKTVASSAVQDQPLSSLPTTVALL